MIKGAFRWLAMALLLVAMHHWLARQLAAIDPIERLVVARDVGTLAQIGALYLLRGLGILLLPALLAGWCANKLLGARRDAGTTS